MAKKNKKAAQEQNVETPEQEDVGGLGKVIVRNEFYRDGYRSLL